ncbi:MAG: HAD-IA family hydrolase [Elusimicrobiota bacterium]
MNSWYLEYISRVTPSEILPGVIYFLEGLKAEGIKIAVGSASKNALTILKQIDMEGYFDAVVDGRKVSRVKPDPEVFILAASELALVPVFCVVFEDAIAGAINGNMKSVGAGSSDVLGKADIVIPGCFDCYPFIFIDSCWDRVS